MSTNHPPAQATPIKDSTKFALGRANFDAVLNGSVTASKLGDAAIEAAAYYLGTVMSLPTGGNAAKRAIHAEAKKRNILT